MRAAGALRGCVPTAASSEREGVCPLGSMSGVRVWGAVSSWSLLLGRNVLLQVEQPVSLHPSADSWGGVRLRSVLTEVLTEVL